MKMKRILIEIVTVYMISLLSGCTAANNATVAKPPAAEVSDKAEDTAKAAEAPMEPETEPAETTDSEPEVDENTDNDKWIDAFKTLLGEKTLYDDLPLYCYYVYDIDKDDIPELILKYGTCEADFSGVVYKYYPEKDAAERIGEMGLGHAVLYTYPKGNGIIRDNAHMGWQALYLITFENGSANEEELYSEEIPADKDYTPAEHIIENIKYIKDTDPSDMSALTASVPKTENETDLELPLIDRYLKLAREESGKPGEDDKFEKPLSSMDFAGVKDGDKESVDIIYNKLTDAWKSNKISIPGDGEYVSYNPATKIILYDVNKDGIDEFLLLSDMYGEPQIDVFEPFNLRCSTDEFFSIYPNTTGSYYLEPQKMFLRIYGIDNNTYHTITRYDSDGSVSFSFWELGNVETGEVEDHVIIINDERTSISREEYLELEDEFKKCIPMCKDFDSDPSDYNESSKPDTSPGPAPVTEAKPAAVEEAD